jgi:competence protein ComEC
MLLFNMSVSEEVLAKENKVFIHFIDVGQADCIFVEVLGGKTLLIDTGDNGDGQKIVNFLKKRHVKKIDYIVATHPHHDHIGGLDDIIKHFEVGKIYTSRVTHDTSSFYDTLKAIRKNNVKIAEVTKHKKLSLKQGVVLEMIGPLLKYASINDQSIVLRLTHQYNTFLFMADAGTAVERKLILKNINIKADVLKVGHHGAYTGTSYNFIKKVNPKIAVISVGENNQYKYPSSSVLKTLKNNNANILRTDKLGTISVISDGKKMVWYTTKYGYIYP